MEDSECVAFDAGEARFPWGDVPPQQYRNDRGAFSAGVQRSTQSICSGVGKNTAARNTLHPLIILSSPSEGSTIDAQGHCCGSRGLFPSLSLAV